MIEEHPPGDLRLLRLRYPGKCSECGIALSRGTEAWYSTNRKVVCLACGPGGSPAFDDAAGASAAAEGHRRKDRRVAQVRKQYGDYAAAVADQVVASDMAASWGKGSEGESRLADYIAKKAGDAVISLHDRLIPGTRTNIDHIWVAQTGVWVVDAKSYKGKLEQRLRWRGDNEVFVGGRNRTKLAQSVERQVEAVKAAIRPDPDLVETPIYGVLCFVGAEWNLLDFPFHIRRIWVAYPGALRKQLRKRGDLSRNVMEHAARRLDLSLRRAS